MGNQEESHANEEPNQSQKPNEILWDDLDWEVLTILAMEEAMENAKAEQAKSSPDGDNSQTPPIPEWLLKAYGES
jgi:hypothetical protein